MFVQKKNERYKKVKCLMSFFITEDKWDQQYNFKNAFA